MKKQDNTRSLINGYSLVEMLITLALISFVLTFVGVALTTMLKASIMSDARTKSRQEIEVLSTSLRLSIGNARSERVQVFESDWTILDGDLIQEEVSPVFTAIAVGSPGNEIHVLPTKADRWVCIATVSKANPNVIGGIQKLVIRTSADFNVIPSSSTTLADHQKCFDPTANPELYDYMSFLTSESVTVNVPSINNGFMLTAYKSSNDNIYIDSHIGLTPLEWIGGSKGPLKPEFTRDAIYKTGLID